MKLRKGVYNFFMSDLEYVTSRAILEEKVEVSDVLETILTENQRGLDTKEDYLAYLKSSTLCITLFAGLGERWRASFESVPGAEMRFKDLPRALYPVQNVLVSGSDKIALGAYALHAVSHLGDSVIVIRGHEALLKSYALSPLGIDPKKVRFVEQATIHEKPLGHGDAVYQLLDIIGEYEYVIVNFAGDLSRPATAETALLAIDALESIDEDVRLILPCTKVKNPEYVVKIDADGLPSSLGHGKLKGSEAQAEGFTNVGLRVYRSDALFEALTLFRKMYYKDETGYTIPGNVSNDFALDNIDEWLCEKKTVRILPIASSVETIALKSLSDLSHFEKALDPTMFTK